MRVLRVAVHTLCPLWVCCFLEPASPLAGDGGSSLLLPLCFLRTLDPAMEWSDWTGCWYQVLRWYHDGCLCPWQAWGRVLEFMYTAKLSLSSENVDDAGRGQLPADAGHHHSLSCPQVTGLSRLPALGRMWRPQPQKVSFLAGCS